MKNVLIALTVVGMAFVSCEKDNGNGGDTSDTDTLSITMGQGYANAVYYSMSTGEVKAEPRNNWDIAFMTDPMSSTVIINEGLGIKLYKYSEDTLDFNQLDTTGIDWTNALYNSDTSWTFGAFDRESKGHPDYGWGKYNDLTHDVLGTDLYVLALPGDVYKKMYISSRRAMDNTFLIRYGDLDQSLENASLKEIPCGNYSSKNFVYFSFATEELVDREPASDSWDIVFTQYHDESIPYIVTGVLANAGLEVAEMRNTPVDDADPASATYSTEINTIGSDWKSFDMGTFSYVVEEELSYFVKSQDGSTYQLIFTGTNGSATGTMEFLIKNAN